MKNKDDLVAAVTRMHQQYSASRIDRDIVRSWVLGLPSYEGPTGAAVEEAKKWFNRKQPDVTHEVRREDLGRLMAVVIA